MKIAALYDIHGNYPALKAVSEQLDHLQPDLIVIGGDIVSGPMPLETLQLIDQLSKKFNMMGISGNNDQDVVDAYNGKQLSLSEHAQDQIRWVADQLSERQILELKRLSLNVTVGDDFFCHAVAKDNTTVFTPHSNVATIKTLFRSVRSPFIICGHTHLQFKLTIGHQQIINAGSIGMPFSDQEGAQWLWIVDNQQFLFKRTRIDKSEAVRLIGSSSYPYVDDFIEQHVKNTMSLSVAYQMLDKMMMDR
jgi:putative phosphoesterase